MCLADSASKTQRCTLYSVCGLNGADGPRQWYVQGGYVGRQYLRRLAFVAFIAADSVAPTAGRFVGRLVFPEAGPCEL